MEFFYCDNNHDPAYVGTHKDGKPFGTLADAETRKARSLAHHAFDRIWKDKLLSRSEANEVVVFSKDLYNHILNKIEGLENE